MVKQSFIRALVLGAGILGGGVAQAADVDGVLKAGFDFGGDTIVRALMDNGDTETIKANEGFFVGAGFAAFNTGRTVSTEVTISWKFTGITAENGDIEFTRFPVDALVFYNFPKARLGAGATYHLNPEIEGSEAGVQFVGNGTGREEYDDALGFLVQVDWRIAEKVAIGLRYTSLEYELPNSGAAAVDASGLGGVFTAMF